MVNVVWGAFSTAVGYFLVYRVGDFTVRSGREVLIVGLGGFLVALMLARAFGRVYAKR